MRKKELLLREFDKSVTSDEIRTALVQNGGRNIEDYEVRNIMKFNDGTALVVINCALEKASKIAEKKKIPIR